MAVTDDFLIKTKETIKEGLKKLNKSAKRLLFVIDEQSDFIGTISDGDIRRYILKEGTLDGVVQNIYQRNPIYITKAGYSLEAARELLLKNKIDLLPIIDGKKVVGAISWEEAYGGEEPCLKGAGNLNIPVIIMAGGKGSRLFPFTNILPKPLIPVGERSVLELIIDEFRSEGGKNYYFTLNYKGEMIKAYFDGLEKDYSVDYIWEKDFFGTAGSLKLAEQYIDDTFIVSNCDVIVKAHYEEVVKIHREEGAYLTILSAMQHYQIPYGIVDFTNGGSVTGIKEKPEYTFHVNTGVYILDKRCLSLIPEGENFDMTDLIGALLENGKKVMTYPVNENDYIDIGQWKEYQKAVKLLCSI